MSRRETESEHGLVTETKKKVNPELLPRALFWFRWGAAWTWGSGILLLALVFYHGWAGGNLFDAGDIEQVIKALGDTGLCVVDEAYEPFAQQSFMGRLPEFPNLIVMRTLSKLGLAGIRLGYMSCAPALLEQFDKIRPPYNVNVLTQAAGWVSDGLPFAHGVRLFSATLYDLHPWGAVARETAWLVGLGALFSLLARSAVRPFRP